MKAIALVVVHGGVADVVQPEHVDARVVDLDNIEAGDPPVELPAGVGFEELCEQANLEVGVDVVFASDNDLIRELEAAADDLDAWDGSADAIEITARNLRAAAARAKGGAS